MARFGRGKRWWPHDDVAGTRLPPRCLTCASRECTRKELEQRGGSHSQLASPRTMPCSAATIGIAKVRKAWRSACRSYGAQRIRFVTSKRAATISSSHASSSLAARASVQRLTSKSRVRQFGIPATYASDAIELTRSSFLLVKGDLTSLGISTIPPASQSFSPCGRGPARCARHRARVWLSDAASGGGPTTEGGGLGDGGSFDITPRDAGTDMSSDRARPVPDASTPDAGFADVTTTSDAPASDSSALDAATADASTPLDDASRDATPPPVEAGGGPSVSKPGVTANAEAGCSCRVPGDRGPAPSTAAWGSALALLLACIRRRTRRTPLSTLNPAAFVRASSCATSNR